MILPSRYLFAEYVKDTSFITTRNKSLNNTLFTSRCTRCCCHNDDHNSMEHVIKALMRVFKFELSECERIMMEAHRNGVALCTVEPIGTG